jgi:serine/threonine protein kinase
MLATGTKLGAYEVVAQIGAGGMEEVYSARDTRLNRDVATKVLPPHLADKPDLHEQFERDSRIPDGRR